MNALSEATRAEISRRTRRSASSAVLVTIVSAPAALLLVVLLGRESVEALGFYGLLTLVVTTGQALLTLGGTIVLTRGGDAPRQVQLIQTRGGLLLAVASGGVVSLVVDLPAGLSPLRLVLLLAVTSLWANAQVAQTARLRLGRATAMQTLATAFQLVFLGAGLALAADMTDERVRDLIYASYVLPLGVIGVWHVARLLRREPEPARSRSGGLTAAIASAYVLFGLTLLFESAERLVALTADDALRTLGLYFACYQVAFVVRKLPNVVGQAFLPGFAYLGRDEPQAQLHGWATRVLTTVGFTSGSLLAVLAVGLDDRLGGSFSSVGSTVAVLAVAFGATAAMPLHGSLLTARGGIGRYQLSLAVASLTFLPLIFTQSILAIGAARGAAIVVLYVACLVSIGDTKPSRHAELAFAVVGGLTCVAVTGRFGLGAGFVCWALVSVAFSLTSRRSGVRAVPLIPRVSAR